MKKYFLKFLIFGLFSMGFQNLKAPKNVVAGPHMPFNLAAATPTSTISPFFCQNPPFDLSGRSADDIFNLYKKAYVICCDRAYFFKCLHLGVDFVKLAEDFSQSTRIKRFFQIISTVKLKPAFSVEPGPFIPIMRIKFDEFVDQEQLYLLAIAEIRALDAYFSAKIISFLDKNKDFLVGDRENLSEQIMFFAIQSQGVSFEDFINFIKIQDELRKDLPQGSFETAQELLTTNENSERMNIEDAELSERNILHT